QGGDDHQNGDHEPDDLDRVDRPAVTAAALVCHPLSPHIDAAPATGALITEGTALIGNGVIFSAVLTPNDVVAPGGCLFSGAGGATRRGSLLIRHSRFLHFVNFPCVASGITP